MKKAMKNSPFDLKSGGQRLLIKEVSDNGSFEGYGSVFGIKDSYSEIVEPGAFASSLEGHKDSGTLPAMLWQHDSGKPIGVYTEVREDSKGLFVRGQLALDTQLGNEAHALLKAGALNGLSIGFMTVKSEYDDDEQVRTLKEIDLWEISLVTFPANGKARVEGVKNLDKISGLKGLRDVEKHLRDEGGYSRVAAKSMVAKIVSLVTDEREVRNARADLNAGIDRLQILMES